MMIKAAIKRFMITALLLLSALLLIQALKPSLRGGITISQAVYDREGRLLRLTLSRDEKYRLWLPLKDLSPLLIQATLLHEDRSFLLHHGVDPLALLRAAWHTYVKADRRIGGSTITMQLARIRYGIHSRAFTGKLTQIAAALWIELFCSKREILEAYLNLAPYGLNIEGAGAASLIYFQKDPGQLTLAEALTLSVIPQSPAQRIRRGEDDLFRNQGLEQARARLFASWTAVHPKDRDQRQIMSMPVALKRPADMPFLAPHFAIAALHADPFDARLDTTLDLDTQTLVERAVRSYVSSRRSFGISNAAALLVDHRTMEVKALIGSVDFFDGAIRGQVNGTAAQRSPGSAIKPFIYGLGIDQGLIHPLTMLKDAPLSFGSYNPENFDNEFFGPLPVRDALIRSRNIPAVAIASKLAEPDLHRFLLQAGVRGLRDRDHYGMALALGAADISMQQLVSLYAMLANRGMLRPIRWFQHQPKESGRRLMSKEASFIVLDMLAMNPRPSQGFRSAWTRGSLPVAWKTGTSFGFRDAWSVGVIGPYVLAVWIGNFEGEGNSAFIGREASAPLFFRIVDALKAQDIEVSRFSGPGLAEYNLKKTEVCAVSGMIPSAACGRKDLTWFIPGVSPIRICDIHSSVSIDARTGLRACSEGLPNTRQVVYEFWPSDMLEIFRQAGIPRRVPPPYGSECRHGLNASHGKGPEITSPRLNVVYNLRARTLRQEQIPLTAVTDADSRTVYWFANEQYLGASSGSEPFFWKPEPGTYVIRAVDDHGRSHARQVKAVLIQ